MPFYVAGVSLALAGSLPLQAQQAPVTMQAEYRQRLGRFGFTTFAGAAQIAPTPGDLSTDALLYAAGVGLRFQLLKRFPLNYRTDVAFGKDGATFYFSVGEAF